MKKSTMYIVMASLCLFLRVEAQENNLSIRGKVVNYAGIPIIGATISIKDGKHKTVSDASGNFLLAKIPYRATITISNIGYKTKIISKIQIENIGNVLLEQDETQLKEIQIVSTGYQNIPKERATGSFVTISNKEINRSVSTSILDRLDGITSGLIFNKGGIAGNNNPTMTIRGRSTIFANPNPLIIVDNFPFEDDIRNINPNDVESITILKDAAAASIWGVRAGNGVIVITTKKGQNLNRPTIEFTSNASISLKPNLNYQKQISSSDYVGVEKYLFDKGYYDNSLGNSFSALSPAVILLTKLRNKEITDKDFNSEIEVLKNHDVRQDLKNYFYRNSLNQQYNLNISGGTNFNRYHISGGFDKNSGNLKPDSYSRYSFTANNTVYAIKDKLEIFTSLNFVKSNSESNSTPYRPFTPYDKLADVNGNALPVVDNQNQILRSTYVDTVGSGRLLDWHYYPLDENKTNRTVEHTNYRFLTAISYKITSALKIQTNYQYEKIANDDISKYAANSYYTRDLINKFSILDPNSKSISRVIPNGDINDEINTAAQSQYFRTQLSFEKTTAAKHGLSALAGFEIKDYSDNLKSQRYYGYDPSTSTNGNGSINPLEYYQIFYDPNSSQLIPTAPSQVGNIDRYRSFYGNISYTYDRRYIVSGSARKDETNLFGVKSNQKGVPLWSVGAAWDISNEGFYHFETIPYLKLRATYGYNGNVDKTTSALLTANAFFYNPWNILYSQVINPPNPSLSWEKIENVNIGIDFSTRENIVSGSIEYFIKKGTDLIGNSPIASQTGIPFFKGNTANSRTNGIDIVAKIKAISKRNWQWDLTFLYSYSRDEITKYRLTQSVNGDIVNSNYSNPIPGYPYSAIFAFRSTSLDAEGNPQGFLNGLISKDYSSIYNGKNPSDIAYKGSGTPTSFGSIRNDLLMGNLSVSVNLVYKFGYFFRRSNVFSGSNYSYNQSDFTKRWQTAGDEKSTTIPSLIYPFDSYRDTFFLGSESLVERGDHLRLQDLRVAYSFPSIKQVGIKSLQVYSYINNIGIIWRANKKGIDPDAGTQLLPAPRTISLGVKATF